MTLKNILVLIFGAILFVGWHFFIGLKWGKDASLDIVSGAVIEFYLFTYIISEHEKREEKKRSNEMMQHLENIERMIKGQKINSGENNFGLGDK